MKKTDQKPQIVIFGRANTGKSTLFNTLAEKKSALVSNAEGVTRDSNIAEVSWRGLDFELVDTGGITQTLEELSRSSGEKGNTLDKKVRDQALTYLNKGDVILFVVDTKTGILPQDEQMAELLKKKFGTEKRKNIFVVANKVDKGKKEEPYTAVFHQLGLGEPLPVSAATGSGTGDLLDAAVEVLPRRDQEEEEQGQTEKEPTPISTCIVGKPNAGKSSLLNSLLEYEKAIVSDTPHTTREPQDIEVTYKDHQIIFTDTAGINKKIRKAEGLEKYGIERSLKKLKKADIALLVLDVTQEITQQERKLIDRIFERKKSLLIALNKWDLVDNKDTNKFIDYVYNELPFATWAPIKFVSAKTGKNTFKIYESLLEIEEQRKIQLSKAQLDRFLNKIVKRHSPTKAKGYKRPYIFEITQTKTDPPKFDVRIGKRDTLDPSYVKFIENQLRKHFGFLGTPINIEVIR